MLAAEEERFGETLERGMAIFEEAAAKGEITGDDAFDLQATYGFPIELTQELARERGLGVNDEEYTRLMEGHREISRQGGTARYEPRFSGAPRTEFVGYERTDVLHRDHRVRRPRRRALPGQARRVAVLSGGRRPGHRRRLAREGGRLARRARRGAAAREATRSSCSQGCGFAEGDRVRAVVPWGVRYATRRTTPRRTSSTRCCRRCSATTSARRARPCGPTSSASTSRIRRR